MAGSPLPALAGLVLLALALGLPLFDQRPNRLALAQPLDVSASEARWAGLGLPSLAHPLAWVEGGLALLALLLIIPLGGPRKPGLVPGGGPWSAVLTFLGLGLATLLWLAAGPWPGSGEDPGGRIGLQAGYWLWLILWAYLAYAPGRLCPGQRRWVPLTTLGLPLANLALVAGGALPTLGLVQEGSSQGPRLGQELGAHLALALVPLVPALVLTLPGAWLAQRDARFKRSFMGALAALQVVPSLALFGILMPLFSVLGWGGLGFWPAATALFLYSLLPLARGSLLGLENIRPDIIDAARGMGMGPAAILWRIQVPLAFPRFAQGLRLAVVQGLGLATLGALIGAGGLGWFVFQGLGQGATDLVVLASMLICTLAVGADAALRPLERMGHGTGT